MKTVSKPTISLQCGLGRDRTRESPDNTSNGHCETNAHFPTDLEDATRNAIVEVNRDLVHS